MSSSEPSSQYGVVLVTAPSREQADAIAQALIAAKLAACLSLLPVHSIYTWQGKVEREDEWQLLIKTDLTKFAALEAIVRHNHPYEVPELIALPILAGSLPYLQWIAEQVDG
ncbi:divalent-cation tolerance protein CutA [Pantanalinema rosaneae CENA516]|uniref:divalent-cation tolerance protein CutA n=1 Tax=Pantanalinema rosaneae TaxID=1620701 RepID=UPI003D6E9D33